MKKCFFPLILILVFFCGCSDAAEEAASAAAEEMLHVLVNTVDMEELKETAKDGMDAVTEKFPALKNLTNREDMQEFLEEHGLNLIRKYLSSADKETQAKAEKLGTLIKVLSPELSDEVDAVLAE